MNLAELFGKLRSETRRTNTTELFYRKLVRKWTNAKINDTKERFFMEVQ